ncbi:MAG: hypothetical protein WCJ30_16280 [Deltaproteobacteria bacterium]
MGLFVARVRFEAEPPANDDILAELADRIGSVSAVESIERDGNELKVATMLDPVAYPYMLKILSERGGVLLDYGTGEPRALGLPQYVSAPWRSHGFATRLWIRVRFLLGLASTARPRA